MGILNITPDSFSDGGQYIDPNKAAQHAITMVEQGADIIDIGGESTRPGSEMVSVSQEIERVVPVIEMIRQKSAIPISIDTRKAEVAAKACQAGAVIINDVSGLAFDPRIAEVARDYDAYLILMHSRGTPENMQSLLEYKDLITEIVEFLENAAKQAIKAGVGRDKIIIDPGIGFAKTVEHNFRIIKRIKRFTDTGYPVLIGASRKSFIGKTLDLPTDQRLEGSLAAAVCAYIYGADIIRVHDVLETVRALRIAVKIKEAGC